nr:receptor-like protein 50 [Malus domestica]
MKTPLLSWLFLLRICYVSLTFHTFVVSTQCPGDQQSLLLQLKNTLTFDPATSQKLVNWKNGSDYCSWEGVSCKEGCVSNLDLSNEWITGGLDNSSPLFGLKSIENLNLANNSFNYTQIPSEFKQLTGLHNLNLSCAGFAGQIPREDLPGLLPNSIGNLKMLSKIDLRGCNFTGSIPSSIADLHQLVYFDLSWNKFNGSVPSFSMAKNLTLIYLSANLLDGTIPSSLFSLPMLQGLELSNNHFSGQ